MTEHGKIQRKMLLCTLLKGKARTKQFRGVSRRRMRFPANGRALAQDLEARRAAIAACAQTGMRTRHLKSRLRDFTGQPKPKTDVLLALLQFLHRLLVNNAIHG